MATLAATSQNAEAATLSPTTVTLTATPTGPTAVTKSLRVTATLTGSSATFHGNVSFTDNGTAIKTAPVSGTTAVLPVAQLPAGHGSLVARYSGDTLNAASTSAALSLVRYYVDVPPTATGYATSLFAADHNLFITAPDGTFAATTSVDKQSAAYALFNFANPGQTPPPCTTAPFSDVPTSSSYCPYVQWLAHAGGAPGGPGATFSPTTLITRSTLAAQVFAVENAGTSAPGCNHAPATDVSATAANCGAIAWVIAQGVVPIPSGAFGPSTTVTRLDLAGYAQNLDSALHRTLYVLIQTGAPGTSQLVPVNLANATVGSAMPGVPNTATAAVVTSDGKAVYVAGSQPVNQEGGAYLEPVSLTDGTVGTPLETGGFLPYTSLALSNDNSKIYGTFVYINTGRVESYATSTPGVLHLVNTGSSVNSLVSAPNGPTVTFTGLIISGSSATTHAYFVNSGPDTVQLDKTVSTASVGVTLSPDGSLGYLYNGPVASGDVTPINTTTGAYGVLTHVPGSGIKQLLITGSGGGSIGYALTKDNTLRGIDLAHRFVGAPLALPGTANSMVIPAPGTFAYVDVTLSGGSHELVPVNLITMTTGTPIPLGTVGVFALLPAQRAAA